jgi:hypothetical protein
MCLAPVIRPEGPAPKGQESIAQGLPWVIPPTRISPEGANRHGENWLRTFELDRVHSPSPFRANRLFRLTQGKPWAMLSWPLRATERKRPNSIGLNDAKHIQEQASPDGSLTYQAARF